MQTFEERAIQTEGRTGINPCRGVSLVYSYRKSGAARLSWIELEKGRK